MRPRVTRRIPRGRLAAVVARVLAVRGLQVPTKDVRPRVFPFAEDLPGSG